jgi:hypothetical protein
VRFGSHKSLCKGYVLKARRAKEKTLSSKPACTHLDREGDSNDIPAIIGDVAVNSWRLGVERSDKIFSNLAEDQL